MTIIRVSAAMVFGLVVVGLLSVEEWQTDANLNLLYIATFGLFAMDAPFIYHWAKEYNKKLVKPATPNT